MNRKQFMIICVNSYWVRRIELERKKTKRMEVKRLKSIESITLFMIRLLTYRPTIESWYVE